MNDLDVLNYSFLNQEYLYRQRNALNVAAADSVHRAALEVEVAELEARVQAEKPIRMRRAQLLMAANAMHSKYGAGYVQLVAGKWVKLTAEQVVELAAKDGA